MDDTIEMSMAESILEGDFCELCGCFITEDGPGHPQLCATCESEATYDDE